MHGKTKNKNYGKTKDFNYDKTKVNKCGKRRYHEFYYDFNYFLKQLSIISISIVSIDELSKLHET